MTVKWKTRSGRKAFLEIEITDGRASVMARFSGEEGEESDIDVAEAKALADAIIQVLIGDTNELSPIVGPRDEIKRLASAWIGRK